MNPKNILVLLDSGINQLLMAAGPVLMNYANSLSLVAFALAFTVSAVFGMVELSAGRGSFAVFRMVMITGRFLLARYILHNYDWLHMEVTGSGAKLAGLIDMNITNQLYAGFHDMLTGMQQPGISHWLTNIADVINFWVANFAIWGAQVIVVLVIGLGWIIQAVLVAVGPYFVDCLIFPPVARWFWGWFTSFFQYAMYPFFANCFVWVYAWIVINWDKAHPGPYTLDYVSGMVMGLATVMLAMVFGLLKVPAVLSDVFRGGSGHHAFPSFAMFRG